jgi:hypothetical protein
LGKASLPEIDAVKFEGVVFAQTRSKVDGNAADGGGLLAPVLPGQVQAYQNQTARATGIFVLE